MLACEIVTGFLFYRRARASCRRHTKSRAGARKTECLPQQQCRGKRLEQILEKLASAMQTPIANMAAERAGTSGANPFREN